MKALLAITCVLALGTHVLAQSEKAGNLGYVTNLEMDKAAGIGYIKFTVPADVLNTTQFSWIRVEPSALAASARTAHLKYWVGRSKADTATTPTAEKAGGASEPRFENFFVPIAVNAGGEYFLTVQTASCSGCVKTAEIQVALFIQHTSTNVAPTDGSGIAPFAFVHNPFTAKYNVAKDKYGLAGYVDLEHPTDIYIKLEMSATSALGAVAFAYQKDSVPDMLNPHEAPETDTYKRFPTEGERTGSYMTNARTLSRGRWYIRPYVYKAASSLTFDFAVGIGSEPSSAGGLVPSLTVLLATVAGLLFYTF